MPQLSLLAKSAKTFGLPADLLRPLGGATGNVFATETLVVKIGSTSEIDREIAAGVAASTAVPVPAILDAVTFAEGSAFLTERVIGTLAADLDGIDSASARARGRSFGQLFDCLLSVVPPDTLPSVWAPGDVNDSRHLLHLDLHPLNVLMSETNEVVAVVDWANAATGPPGYDRARSASILALDPSAQRLVSNPLQAEFISGLSESARFAELESTDFTWACEFLLRDLSSRHSFEDLAPARDALVDSRAGRLGIFGSAFK